MRESERHPRSALIASADEHPLEARRGIGPEQDLPAALVFLEAY